MAVKILVDSASDFNEKQAQEMGVVLMPIKVQFGEEEFQDGFNLLPQEFYEKLVTSSELPQTSLINEYQFTEKFKEITVNGDEIVAITLSSKLSGTYNCAVEASKKFDGKVFVVDSLNACFGEGILCKYAVELANKGMSAQEIVAKLEEKKSKIKVMAVLDTLKYLKKGGRISATTAFVGEMLSIKPMIAVIDGEVKVVGKCHGLKKGFMALCEDVQKSGGIDFDMPHGLIYSGNDLTNINSFKTFSERIWKENEDDIGVSIIGSTIGTHIGPGTIGVVYFQK